MGLILNPYSFGGGAINFVSAGSAESTSNTDTYSNLNPNPGGTFTGIALVIGWFGNGGSRTGSSVTVNGVSATFLARQHSAGNATIEIWVCAGTACTDVDIVLSGAALGLAVDAITFTGANAPTTATDTAGSTADPSVLTIDVQAGGLIIAGGWGTDGGTSTWSNATEVTDRSFADGDGNTFHLSSAYNASASAQTNLAVSDNYSVAFFNAGAAVAIR